MTSTPAADENATPRRLAESPQRTHPGWTRLQWKAADGHDLGAQFRGPGGEIISNKMFHRRVKSGEIPTIDPASGEPKAPAGSTAGATQPTDPPTLAASPARREAAGGDAGEAAAPAFELPTAEPSTRRAAPGQASAAELALTAQIALIIITSVASLLTRTPELAMSDLEAQAFATPLGNLAAKSSLNRRYGRYLADSSDYTLLGYAAYGYAMRVLTGIAARQQAEQASAPGNVQRGYPYAVPTAAPAGGQPASAGAAGAGAANAANANGAERTAPAAGGIGGAARGTVPGQATNFVGYNPIQAPRAG